MACQKICDFLLHHAEGAIGIDRAEIALCAEHGLNHREDENRVERKIKRAAPAFRLQRRYDRSLVENIVERRFVGAFHRAGFSVEGCRGTLLQPGAEMRGGVLEHMRQRFQVVARKPCRTQKIFREGIVFTVMLQRCGVIHIRRPAVLARLPWFPAPPRRWSGAHRRKWSCGHIPRRSAAGSRSYRQEASVSRRYRGGCSSRGSI